MNSAVFFALDKSTDRGLSLSEMIRGINEGAPIVGTYQQTAATFLSVPNSPLCYWLPKSLLSAFETHAPVIKKFVVRSGSVTFDDFRFLRLVWEIPGDLQVESNVLNWHPISKGGEYSLFVADVHLLVDWRRKGDYVGICVYLHRPREGYGWGVKGRNAEFFCRPSITWSRRSQKGFSARVLPSGNVFSDKSPVVQHKDPKMLWYFVGIANTTAFRALLQAQVAFGSFEVGAIERMPLPYDQADEVVRLGKAIYNSSVSSRTLSEVSRLFCRPLDLTFGMPDLRGGFLEAERLVEHDIAVANRHLEELEFIAQGLYGVVKGENAGEIHHIGAYEAPEAIEDELKSDVVDADVLPLFSQAHGFVSYAIGCSFGRWDIRFVTRERPAPAYPDPFAPLPVCPPGMLQNAAGLPARPTDVPADYPLRITWGGILPDDAGHPDDIERRVRDALRVIWAERADAIEQEACEILGVKTLREYFRKPGLFFSDHLKRYSKSRRQAPIYWPLSTPSGSYTLWLYYHRLSDQTLYTCVNDFVEPKRKAVEARAAALGHKATRSRQEEAEHEALVDLAAELGDFRDELLRLAPIWKPNLNDGVQITAAPLWQLFQHKPWQKKLKETWAALEKGDYDWAHLACSLWPDRVREKCKTDKSLAIAHDLEALYVEPPASARKKAGRKTRAKPKIAAEALFDDDDGPDEERPADDD